MFKKLTKLLLSQVDPKQELVPVESIADDMHFRPLWLLRNKNKPNTTFHSAPYYQEAGFKLDDVLLPGKHVPLQEESRPITVTTDTTEKVEGGITIPLDAVSIGLEGGGSLSYTLSITARQKGISQASLEEVRRERKINMEHSFIRQLQRTGSNLFVVIEVLEAAKEGVFKESVKEELGFWAKIYDLIWGKGSREKTQSITVPEGCILAFKTIQIDIRDGAWDLNYFPAEFVRRQAFIVDDPSQGILGAVMEEVKHHCQIFSNLPPDLLFKILTTIKVVMRDTNLRKELSQKMEEVPEKNDGYELKTKSPDLKDLFSTLQLSPRDRLLQLAEGITYILDALHELLEDQLLLLLKSLEMKIVPQQLKLVENLLKQDLVKGNEPFRFDARLLSFSQEEKQDLTIALVLLSGVQLREDGSAVPRRKHYQAMAALFVALYALKLLSGSK